jgi:hypothetical protein
MLKFAEQLSNQTKCSWRKPTAHPHLSPLSAFNDFISLSSTCLVYVDEFMPKREAAAAASSHANNNEHLFASSPANE